MRFPDAQGLALGLVRAAPKAPRRLCLEVPRHLLSNRVGDMIHSCNRLIMTWYFVSVSHNLSESIEDVLTE